MHNWPGLKTGVIDVQPGPRMASSDNFDILIEGVGGHGKCNNVYRHPFETNGDLFHSCYATFVQRPDCCCRAYFGRHSDIFGTFC